MLAFRSMDLSVLKTVTDLFLTPPAGTLSQNWNVYNEDQFADPAFVPAPPFVWLIQGKARPNPARLPLLVLERAATAYAPYEIGTEEGSVFPYNVHVFGRNPGERADLAAFLFQQVKRVTVYDFDTTPPTQKYTVAIESKVSVPNTVRPDIGIEGALSNFESFLFQLVTKE